MLRRLVPSAISGGGVEGRASSRGGVCEGRQLQSGPWPAVSISGSCNKTAGRGFQVSYREAGRGLATLVVPSAHGWEHWDLGVRCHLEHTWTPHPAEDPGLWHPAAPGEGLQPRGLGLHSERPHRGSFLPKEICKDTQAPSRFRAKPGVGSTTCSHRREPPSQPRGAGSASCWPVTQVNLFPKPIPWP